MRLWSFLFDNSSIFELVFNVFLGQGLGFCFNSLNRWFAHLGHNVVREQTHVPHTTRITYHAYHVPSAPRTTYTTYYTYLTYHVYQKYWTCFWARALGSVSKSGQMVCSSRLQWRIMLCENRHGSSTFLLCCNFGGEQFCSQRFYFHSFWAFIKCSTGLNALGASHLGQWQSCKARYSQVKCWNMCYIFVWKAGTLRISNTILRYVWGINWGIIWGMSGAV